jgi:hypothetical protein
MLMSANVPPNWWTIAIPWWLASHGLLKSMTLPSISTVPDVGLWTPREDPDKGRFPGTVIAEQASPRAPVSVSSPYL